MPSLSVILRRVPRGVPSAGLPLAVNLTILQQKSGGAYFKCFLATWVILILWPPNALSPALDIPVFPIRAKFGRLLNIKCFVYLFPITTPSSLDSEESSESSLTPYLAAAAAAASRRFCFSLYLFAAAEPGAGKLCFLAILISGGAAFKLFWLPDPPALLAPLFNPKA